ARRMSDLSGTQPGTTPSPGEIAGERPAGDVSMEFGGLLPGLLLPEVRQRDSVNLEEDDDYSSDSSAGGPSQQRPQQQSPQQQSPQQQSPQAQHEVRPVSRRRRPPRPGPNTEERDISMSRRTVVYPEVYRYCNKPSQKSVWNQARGFYPFGYLHMDVEGMASLNLEDLVKYSSADVLSRAWPLLPANAKNLTFAPFSPLPEIPDILNVRHPDTDQVARFMRLTAVEITRRNTIPTLVFLRSLLVQAAVNLRAKKTEEASLAVNSYSEDLLRPNWEDESSETGEELVADSSTADGEGWNPNDVEIPSNDANHVDSLDWAVAVLSDSLQPKVHLRVLRLLHRVVDRCGLNSSSVSLQSWGLQQLTRMLLLQAEKETAPERGSSNRQDDAWLRSAIALLFKLFLASKKLDTLLSLLRWVYRHPATAEELPLHGIQPWITSIQAFVRPRMRLSFPFSRAKSYIPLAHSLGLDFSRSILGVCVVLHNDEPHGILLTRNGIYKMPLKPPYNVLVRNEDIHLKDCHGVFLEKDKVAVQSERAGVVTFYDVETLQVRHVLDVCGARANEEFQVYYGMGKFVSPHFFHDARAPLFAGFDASMKITGTVEPSVIYIAPTIQSVTVQFFLYVQPTSQSTSLELISLSLSGRNWLSVRIDVDGGNSCVCIVFDHCGGVVTEIQEAMQEGWALWSATLISSNEVAGWNVSKDGVLLESSGSEDVMFQPAAPAAASIRFLEGSFSGFISGFQIWHRSESISELVSSDAESLSRASETSLLCSFKMNEGAGCCLRSANGTHVWRGTAPSWCAPRKSARGRAVEESEVIPYLPAPDYYVVTNECEMAIVENGFCTWVDAAGRILEQRFLNVRPSELYYLCTYTSRMYSIVSDKSGLCSLQWVQTPSFPTSYIHALPSMKSGGVMCEKIHILAKERRPPTPLLLSKYLLHHISTALLNDMGGGVDKHHTAQLFHCSEVSLQTVSRLLDICEELIAGIASLDVENDFHFLLLSVCGRLLTRQIRWMGRGCPPRLVSTVVGMYERLYEHQCGPESFLAEVQRVFVKLHRVFLVECVSHDYQLRRMMEARRLKDVKDLLVPEYLPSLVASVIEKDLNKPLMEFLNRLNEECLAESECLLNGQNASFRPSTATLATLLGILSQKKNSQWQLTSIALLNSLCKGILRIFSRLFPPTLPGKKWAAEELDKLKQTSIGTVVFPIAHFLTDLDIDTSVAVKVLYLLNGTREALAAYIPSSSPQSVRHCFTETHRVFAPAATTHSTAFDLRHARHIEVAYEEPHLEALPQVQVSVVTNDFKRVSETLDADRVVFESGGKLEITSIPTGKNKDATLTVTAQVELQTQSTDWIREMCFALSQAILRITHQLLLTDLPDTILLSRESLFRGGLSPEVLKQHCAGSDVAERLLDTSDQAELLQLCEGTGELLSEWQIMYGKRRIPYQERLEPLLRSFCASHVWHSHRPRSVPLAKSLEDALDFIRKKAFLILEALQQGGMDAMLQRSQFLLKMVNPRARLEAIIAEYQQTEEPITSESRSVSRRLMPNFRSVTSVASRSRDCTGSRSVSLKKWFGAGASDLSNLQYDTAGSLLRPRDALLGVAPINEWMQSSPENTSSQILNFLLRGHNGMSNEQLVQALVKKAQQAMIHTAAYKLQEELCAAHQSDEGMTSAIVSLHLLYRELAHLQHHGGKNGDPEGGTGGGASANPAGSSRPDSMEHHYIDYMIGCGFDRELELQHASCSFLHSVIQQNLLHLPESGACSKPKGGVEPISLCAMLCHPWDNVDMSIIRPANVFRVLKKYMFLGLDDSSVTALETSAENDIWLDFLKECGIFSLLCRAVVIPNSLQSVERVSIVEGDTIGVQVEDMDVCCLARNTWRALKIETYLKRTPNEIDSFPGLSSGCLVTEMPHALYFEVQLEIIFKEGLLVSIGITSSPFATTMPVAKENAVVFSSDGTVSYGRSTLQFSTSWLAGDVIGCGVMAPFNSVFFTRNGEFLGIATECSFQTMRPLVAAQASASLVKLVVNFGSYSPFRFDLATLHGSCRARLNTNPMLADSAFVTAHYLVTLCYKNLLHHEQNESTINEDSVCALLEEAAIFLREVVVELVRRLRAISAMNTTSPTAGSRCVRDGNLLLARLFVTVNVVIDCFRFNAVTSTTHLEVLRLCSFTLIDAHDRWAKVRAARCLRNAARTLRQDYFGEAVQALRRFMTQEAIVNSLVDLARTKLFLEHETPAFVPRWLGGATTVMGKGAFYGASPMPSRGRHMIGFRIRRRQQEGRGVGAPLGGCYYVGLTHGQPPVSNMTSLISRDDVYVLQDTDDQDQVPQLLLRRHCIPRNSQRRIYGNDEIVWLELNADAGEITYYRDKMIPIGLAFANISCVDNLYPFVFHFNEDAVCELIQATVPIEDSRELFLSGLRRSVAIHTLQQLHVVPYFGDAVSQWIHRFLSRAHQDLDNCLLALAVLGGEKSCEFCLHETHGAVVVDSIFDLASKAIVHLEADGDMRVFATELSELKSSFVKPLLFSLSEPDSLRCCGWLFAELSRSLFEASAIAPLMRCEEEKRGAIETHYRELALETMNLVFLRGLNLLQENMSATAAAAASTDMPLSLLQSTSRSFMMVNGFQPASRTPVTIDQRLSTNSLYTPNPSIAVTSGSGYSVVRGNVLFENAFTFAVSITTKSSSDIMLYVGVSSETELFTDPKKVVHCKKTWALCSHDAEESNSVNCAVEPGMIFSSGHILFGSGDLIIVQVDRREGTASFSRIRSGKCVDFGVLFERIPLAEKLRPFVLAGADTVVVFSFLNSRVFPARSIFPLGAIAAWESRPSWVHCSACEAGLSKFWYESEGGIYLCQQCFNSWQFPKVMFHLFQVENPLPDYMVSRHCPKELICGDVVEFVESNVLTWAGDKGVNIKVEGAACLATNDSAFATLGPLNSFSNQRVDISLGHVAGVEGFPFGGLQPFSVQWRVGNILKSSCRVESDMLLVSSTVIPHGTRVVLELTFAAGEGARSFNTAGLFMGVTKLARDCRLINTAELDRCIAEHSVWGIWCDTKTKVSSSITLYLLVDTSRVAVLVSSSLLGLQLHPVVVSCTGLAEEETSLRVVVYSRDACVVTARSGFLSANNSVVEASLSPVAVGFLREGAIGPATDVMRSSCFIFDSVAHTLAHSAASWQLSPLATEEGSGILFAIGDTLTITREEKVVAVYRNGLLLATRKLTEHDNSKNEQLLIYFSTRGTFATLVPPLYGKSHLGRVVRTYGDDVGIVECLCPCPGKRRYAVRAKDVRFCALAADSARLKLDSRVAFKAGSLSVPRRGTVMSIENNSVNVRDEEEKRIWFSLQLSSLYIVDNEGPHQVLQGLYALPTLPTSTVTRVFEVGKTKYRPQRNGSYNGIMFDLLAHDTIVLTGLSVMTHTTGRNRVEVFFKKGSHHMHERDATAWTKVFSNFVEMHSERQFAVKFSGIHVEANTTFALYINATHNCGVGHYTKEDGCSGTISSKMDSDGILTVFVGRTSESSSPFLETVPTPRGFCGSIMYMQNKDTRPPLIERVPTYLETLQNKNEGYDDVLFLQSLPVSTRVVANVEFVMEVFEAPILVRKVVFPILTGAGVRQARGPTQLFLSLFYSPLEELAVAEDTERKWVWVYNAMLPLRNDMCELCMDGLALLLKRGRYLVTATCSKIEGALEGRKSARLSCFLASCDASYTVKNNFYAAQGFVGDIVATITSNVIKCNEVCSIFTGGRLNQNNSASYNGIMFDIRSRRDILLEEVFCVAQTTTDNVNVKVFWKEGSLEGAEKIASQWQEAVSKDLHLSDKQFFSPGPLNLHLRAGQVYAVYINTTSSCGVRFYNSSDGHLGDVGDEFEDDGMLTIFVGKKSESPLPFAEIPAEPRALRGRIIYRTFIQKASLARNHAVFPALRGLVVTRILAALIAYVGGSSAASTLFEDKNVIDVLAKLATANTTAFCDAEAAGNLLSSTMRGNLADELRDGTVTLPLFTQDTARFSSFGKGDLALVASGTEADLSGQLVRLAGDPSDNWHVLARCEATLNQHRTLPVDHLLPIIICPDCNQPFATQEVCQKTGKRHMPLLREEEQLMSVFARYLVQRGHLSAEASAACAKSLVLDPMSRRCRMNLQIPATQMGGGVAVACDGWAVEYTISPDLLLGGKEDIKSLGFVCPFTYHEVMGAFVSVSFTRVADAWEIIFLSDLPFRLGVDAAVKLFALSLEVILRDGTRQDLLSASQVYYAVKGGPIHQELPTLASSLHYSCISGDGCIHFYLSVKEVKFPTSSPLALASVQRWTWESGRDTAQLQPGKNCVLQGPFDFANWPAGRPRFWQFSVASDTNEKVFFLEVHVLVPKPFTTVFLDKIRNHTIRCSFSLSRNEVLNLALTVDGDFLIYDEDDNIRCHVAAEDLQLDSPRGLSPRIAVVNVGSDAVTVHLHAPIVVKRARPVNCFSDDATDPGFYVPKWVSYEPLNVNISRNGLTARCCNEGGQAVIGSPLPMTGLSAFVIQMDRSDRARGDSLGSGHFAGIVVSTFHQLTPHFGAMCKEVDSVWAVQDVYDADSLPTQEPIPPLGNSSNQMFLVGTNLHFLLDRENGTLSLARDNESPRVIFRNIPSNLPVSPFVRLDHAAASATIAAFSCTAWGSGGILTSPSMILSSQPITPTILRRLPYHVVFSMFSVFRHVVGILPSRQVSLLEEAWSDRFNCSRFAYRLTRAVQVLVEVGAFSRRMARAAEEAAERFCLTEEIQRVIQGLSASEQRAVVVHSPGGGEATVVMPLPDRYEVIGHAKDDSMVHLLYFAEDGPSERTLHLLRFDDSEVLIHPCNLVTRHACVMHQEEIIQPLAASSSWCGIITSGWYDCTLNSLPVDTLQEYQQRVIAMSLLSALEHWHLHNLPHGHVSPKNVYLRIVGESVVACTLWNVHVLLCQDPSASPGLRIHGRRNMESDRWSCAHILTRLSCLLKAGSKFSNVVKLLRNQNLNFSEVLDQAGVFAEELKRSVEGQVLCLRTGDHLGAGAGSYNGIMFDVVAKHVKVRVTKLSFVPDTTVLARVTLFVHDGTFMGVESERTEWRLVLDQEIKLIDKRETELTDFDPIPIPAGERVAFFLHTTSGNGVLFYSETDGVRANMAAVEEENDHIGITVGKKSENVVPFMGIQNQKRLLRGSITYVLPSHAGGYRSRLMTGSCESPTLLQEEQDRHPFGTPVIVTVSRPALVLDVDGDEYLVFTGENCEWLHKHLLRRASFTESSELVSLDVALRQILCKRRIPPWAMPHQYSCNQPIVFHERTQSAADSEAFRSTVAWWVSDPITASCFVSVWQAVALTEASLRLMTSSEVTSLPSAAATESLLNHGQAFLHIDEWARSVRSSDNTPNVVRRLTRSLAEEHLYLVFGPTRPGAANAPLAAFLTRRTDDITVHPATATTALVSVRAGARFQKYFLFNGALLGCSAEEGKTAVFSKAASVTSQRGIRVTQLPLLDPPRQTSEDGTTTTPAAMTEQRQPFAHFFMEVESWENWSSQCVTLHTQSASLEVFNRCVRQTAHGGPYNCTVTKPIFGGERIHEIELRIVSSSRHSVQLTFQHSLTNWSLPIPLPLFAQYEDCYLASASSSGGVQCVHLFLRVFPQAKRAFASVNGGMIYEVIPDADCPSEFQLAISLSGLAASVQVLHWRVFEKVAPIISRDVLETIWSRLGVGCISPNVSHFVGVLTRHSRATVNSIASRKADMGIVSQIEATMVSYARQLFATVILRFKASSLSKQLQVLLPFTPLRGDLVALEALVATEMRRSSFFLLASACACLATPTVAQKVEKVETSVNLIFVSLTNETVLPFLSTAFGPTLTLLLLRTATVYTRSIRHMALRGVLQLLKTDPCALPPHGVLSASFDPLLRMMNGLCWKGRTSSVVVQLGISLICELIRRYRLERPTLTPPGKKSAVPYAVAISTKIALDSITSNPPVPLPYAFTEDTNEAHRIEYELRAGTTSNEGVRSCYGVFSETFRPTFGAKRFEVVLNSARKGNVVVGWEMEAGLPGSRAFKPAQTEEASRRTQLPSCGYSVDPSGKVYVCLSRKRESQPLKARAKVGDVLIVKCLYHEQAVIITLRRGVRNESVTRFETYPNETLALPVFFADREEDATFNGEHLADVSTGMDVAQLYNRLQEFPGRLDTGVIPQSYDFYAELALFCQTVVSSEKLSASLQNDAVVTVHAHDLAGFPYLSEFLGVGAFSNDIPLDSLVPYVKRLQIFDVLTSVFSVVVDLRRRTELFELWRKLKFLCSAESSEKIQNETMRPFRNRSGHKASVIVHTMQASPLMRLGPYPTLMRSIFGQLFVQLQKSPISTFYASPMFTVKLAGFGSTDAGGPYRDILSQLATEIMTTHPNGAFQLNPLFAQCGRGGQSAVMPNVSMALNSQSSLMFEFFGKLLASCFLTKDLLAVKFPPLFWKRLLAEETTCQDLIAIDLDIMRQLTPEQLMDLTAEELEDRFPGILESWSLFVAENAQLGLGAELPPSTLCSARALGEHISSLELHKYDTAVSYIQRGFDEVVPLYTLNAFRWQQVELMICGTPKLSYDALLGVCQVTLPPTDAQMFLDVLASMTDEDRMLLLRFTTGQTRLPLREAIKVQRSGTHDSLPTSSTCFFTLRLPSYTSYDAMREKLLYAIRQCKAIDTDGQAREHIILDN
ncbi:transferase, partial [Trypanosoma conorhini]